MRPGIVKLSGQDLGAADWDEITAITRRILLQGIHMRNEQFSCPFPDERVRAIEAGEIEPMAFDYTGVD